MKITKLKLPFIISLTCLTLLAGCGGKSSSTYTKNNAPLAYIDDDQEVAVGSTVTLDGSKSVDYDKEALVYYWNFESKPADSDATLQVLSTPSTKVGFTADKAGTYVVSLVVNDGKEDSKPDTVTIRVLGNQVPTVAAGNDITTTVAKLGSTLVRLSAEGQDPDGDTLPFEWSIVSKPSESQLATIQSHNAGNATFTPDAIGTYEFKVTTTDGKASASDTIKVNIVRDETQNNPPVAKAENKYVVLGKPVTLDASESFDVDKDIISYNWTIKSKPKNSTAELSSIASATPTLLADKLGDYDLELTVSDGINTSEPINIKVKAQLPINTLSYSVIDADYSKALDKVIMISSRSNQLHSYDIATNTEQTINLPLIPTTLALSTDGLFAVVGYEQKISYIDLANNKVLKTLTAPTAVTDLVLSNNNHIYVLPKSTQDNYIYSINLTTNAITIGNNMILAETIVKAHPNGSSLYGTSNKAVTTDIDKYDITSPVATKLYDSPYNGEYPICGNLWLSEEGSKIFTACGNIFKTSDNPKQDMLYSGTLTGAVLFKDLVHSTLAGKVVGIPAYKDYKEVTEDTDTQLYTYDASTLKPSEVINLPYFVNNNQGYKAHGQSVFFNNTGDQLIVILKADTTAGLTYNTGITSIPYPAIKK